MAKVKLSGYRCDRCGHEWLPREKDADPKVCPKCKSPYWNTPPRVQKEYFGPQEALEPTLGQPVAVSHKRALLASGDRVGFADSEWVCGCIGKRYEPGDNVSYRPCAKHRQFAASLHWVSSQGEP